MTTSTTTNGGQAPTKFYPTRTLACGCRITLGTDVTLAYCAAHSLAYDCAEAFRRAAPRAYEVWLAAATGKK